MSEYKPKLGRLFLAFVMREHRAHPQERALCVPYVPPIYRGLIEKTFEARTNRKITKWGELVNNNGPEQIILISPERTLWDQIKEKYETFRLSKYLARITDLF